MERHSNPGLYRRLCLPHESVEALNAEVRAFVAAVRALREKHRIPELIMIWDAYAMRDGEEMSVQSGIEFGDPANSEIMVARALGKIQGDRQQRISDALRARAVMAPTGGG